MQFLINMNSKFLQVLFHFVSESSSYTLSSKVHDVNKVGKWLLQEVVISWEMINHQAKKWLQSLMRSGNLLGVLVNVTYKGFTYMRWFYVDDQPYS